MEAHKAPLGVLNYSASQPSLESIFLSITASAAGSSPLHATARASLSAAVMRFRCARAMHAAVAAWAAVRKALPPTVVSAGSVRPAIASTMA